MPILIAELERKLPATVRHQDALDLRRRYPTVQTFFDAYNADILTNVLKVDKTRIFIGKAPDFSTVKEAMGEDTIVIWIEVLLFKLSEFVGAREKLPEPSMYQLALMFIHDYPYLKLSEFAYFIAELMGGHYGIFYGTVDPMVIANAFQHFVKERDYALSRLGS